LIGLNRLAKRRRREAGAGPEALHAPARGRRAGEGAVYAGGDWAGSSRLCIRNRIKTSERFAGAGASLLSAFP